MLHWPVAAAGSRHRLDHWTPRIILVFILASAVLAFLSRGIYMDDDLLHLQIARSCWTDPLFMLDEWGRPGFTIPYAVLANIGSPETAFLIGRLLSVVITGATAWLTWRIAKDLRVPTAWSAPILLLAMPLYFSVSFTTTTETIAALYVAAGTYLILRQRWVSAALILAILPTTRHELIVLVAGIGVYMLWRKRFVAFILLAWAEVAWNLAVWWVGKTTLPPYHYPFDRYFSTTEPGILGQGAWTHYIDRWLTLSGGGIAWLTCCGIALIVIRILYHWKLPSLLRRRHPRRELWGVMTVGVVGLLSMFTVLYAINRFSSGGYARFIIPIAPWMALLGAMGLFAVLRACLRPMLTTADRGRYLLLCGLMLPTLLGSMPYASLISYRGVLFAFAALVILSGKQGVQRAWMMLLLVIVACELVFQARPHQLSAEHIMIREVVADLRAKYPGHTIHGSTPWVEFFSNQPVWRHNLPAPWNDRDPAPSLFIFEQIHGKPETLLRLTGQSPEDPAKRYFSPQVEERWLPERDRNQPYVRVFERKVP